MTDTARRDFPDVMTIEDLSEYLNVPVSTIYHWRHAGRGPDAVPMGRHIRYLKSEVDLWLRAGGDRRAPRRRRQMAQPPQK